MRDPQKTVGNLIDRQGTAYLGSTDGECFPNIKAMLPPREREGIRTFYFTTNTSSLRVKQYRENPKACVYFCDKRFFRGVMLRGTVEVLEDEAIKERVWRAGDERYYAAGPNDPDYCVLRFTALDGRYYSDFHSENFTVPVYTERMNERIHARTAGNSGTPPASSVRRQRHRGKHGRRAAPPAAPR
jgi:Uncharacterized stress protein (general stress protein 26)